jgi:CheY-like chemotaxis protein
MTTEPATILCIDDERHALLIRKLLFESAGFRVLTAASGKEGIRVFSSNAVSLVVLDYWMPGMNGLSVAREIKRLNPNTPILMLSAFNTILDEVVGTVDRWIRKGEENPEHLLEIVREMANRSGRPDRPQVNRKGQGMS